MEQGIAVRLPFVKGFGSGFAMATFGASFAVTLIGAYFLYRFRGAALAPFRPPPR